MKLLQIALACLFAVPCLAQSTSPDWIHLSSARGEIEAPNSGGQQTSATVFDIDKDGVNDFVITERTAAPSVIGYLRTKTGWRRFVIEAELVQLEAGSTFGDVDGDGHLDIFCAEMRLNGGNPDSKIYILLGDGKGGFRQTVVATGFDNHESKLADLDGDGALDILGKPYNYGSPRLDIWLNRQARR